MVVSRLGIGAERRDKRQLTGPLGGGITLLFRLDWGRHAGKSWIDRDLVVSVVDAVGSGGGVDVLARRVKSTNQGLSSAASRKRDGEGRKDTGREWRGKAERKGKRGGKTGCREA